MYDFCRLCHTPILLYVRLNGLSHLLVHNNELQTAQKEKTTKLKIHQLKNITITKKFCKQIFEKTTVTKMITNMKLN